MHNLTISQTTNYILSNNYDGSLYESTNLLDCFNYLNSSELKEWYFNRDFIPCKSKFIIDEINSKGKRVNILSVSAKRTFPNIIK